MKLITFVMAAMLATPVFAQEQDPQRCKDLRAELKRIDERARQRSTTSLQSRRKEVKDEMWSLRCSEMEPKR